MKMYSLKAVDIVSGYLFDKQELNRKTTVNAVYDRFYETGRISAFDFNYDPNDSSSIRPHFFWDSDVAKWMEAAAYIIRKTPDANLEQKVDTLVAKIKEHQGDDGYFNIYFTVCEPDKRFSHRDHHELYCAGHLMEAAVAYAESTGKKDFLECMEKYADYIHRVFVEEKSAAFYTPGHEEIELALIKMYLSTGKKKYLELAEYFIDTRGIEEQVSDSYNQSHLPVRRQADALGHAVRAVYLYTGMARLAAATGDKELTDACKRLWYDIARKKMYVTGGLGSTVYGEAFTVPYDLPNDLAYTETCAGIGLAFFNRAMMEIDNDAKYADVIERALYNGILSGVSLDGRSFFYENPLEIRLADKFTSRFGSRRLPPSKRAECFECSCCPPNLLRLIASLGDYIYGHDGDMLFVNQFVSSKLDDGGVVCTQKTEYPRDGKVTICAEGVGRVAVRIPEWCEKFEINVPYVMENGYAVVENSGEICVNFDMTPKAVFADPRIKYDASRLCVMRGPVVYCAESVDNGDDLHSFVLPSQIKAMEQYDDNFGLYTLEIPCAQRQAFDSGVLYASKPPVCEPTTVKLIPYNCFANRGETDMLVWLCYEKT